MIISEQSHCPKKTPLLCWNHEAKCLFPIRPIVLIRYNVIRLDLVASVAPLKAVVNLLCQVGWDGLAELLNVLSVNGVRETKSSIDNIGVEGEETLGNLVGTWVLAVECGNKGGGLTVVVELKVDGAHGEYGSLKLVHLAGNLRVLSGANKAVLQDISELDASIGYSQKFCSSWVNVGSVDATLVEEADGCRDAKASEDRECLDVLVWMSA